jgi:LysR family transcriptional regulator, nitrogen assimilation regulatory protein
MNLRWLWYFLSVMSGGSISNGAARLDVSQANLSATITTLEEYLGAPLFERTSHGLRPTAMALRFRDFAVAITIDLEQAFLDLKAGRSGDIRPVPVISFDVPNGSVADWAIMRGMMSSIPRGGARGVRLVSDLAELRIPKLDTVAISYGLTGTALEGQQRPGKMVSDQWILISTGNRFRGTASVDWSDLEKGPLRIARMPGSPELRLFRNVPRPEIVGLGRQGALLDLLLQAGTPLLLPRSCLLDGFGSKGLRFTQVVGAPLAPAIYVQCLEDSAQNVKRLAAEISKELAQTLSHDRYRATQLQVLEHGLELQAFRCFSETIEMGSTNKAAQNLGLAQPALSRQIRKLETAAGRELFERSQQGMAPTDASIRLQLLTKTVLADLAAGQVQMRRTRANGHSRAMVRFGIIPAAESNSPIARAVASTINEWKSAYPEAEVIMAQGYTSELLRWLRTHLIDFAIIDTHEREPGLILNPIFTEPLSLIYAEGSEWDTGESEIAMSDIEPAKLCLPSKQFGLRAHFDQAMAEIDSSAAPGLQIDGLAVSIGLVAMGKWATILPVSAVHHLLSPRGLRHRTLAKPSVSRRICSVQSLRIPQSPASVALMKSLESSITRQLCSS